MTRPEVWSEVLKTSLEICRNCLFLKVLDLNDRSGVKTDFRKSSEVTIDFGGKHE
jgi:hypothetical protein